MIGIILQTYIVIFVVTSFPIILAMFQDARETRKLLNNPTSFITITIMIIINTAFTYYS